MAIQIADGFQLRVAKPLDDRQSVETIAQLDPTYGYEGQIVYVKDVEQFYTCYKDENGSLAYKVMKNGGVAGDAVYTSTPIGTVLSFAGQTPPNGYLLCDGGSYAVADYQDLYDVIGNTYGGDTEYFNVPNLINKFIQGSTTSGTEKEAGLPNIEGELVSLNAGTSNFKGTEFVNGAFSAQTKWNTINGSGNTDSYGEVSFNASKSNAIYGNSDTVQPPALTMVYIIKAFHTNEGVDAPVELEDSVVNHINRQVDSKLVEDMSDYINERVEDRVTEVVHRLIEGTEYPTTETCPVGCWYGMYYE